MTPQQLSDAIGAIYDCALEPERWPNALQQVSALSGAGFNFVIAHDIEKNQAGRIFQHGGTTDWILQYCVKYAPINPLTTASWLRPIGEVYNRASLVSNDEWFEGRFFNEYIRPS